jgi:hypothetical protein
MQLDARESSLKRFIWTGSGPFPCALLGEILDSGE